ncbi:MAG: SURF1 family protein [Candidatus Planktophila sp.]|nr:SURF1 family protein [Candidatus Planktophila sp.]
MSTEVRTREPWAILKSLIALALIVLCIWAAQWQYHRGIDRHARNTIIEERIAKDAIDLANIDENVSDNEWRSITTTGVFDQTQQILLRNRYSEGKYGYEVLTLFTSKSGEKFWVDRGWVQAGETATTAPEVTRVPETEVTITGRFRLDSSLPRGSFFALPGSGEGLVSELNAQSQLDTEKFYLDLLEGSDPSLTPAVPAQLPSLSDGPHMAYALQWLFFGGLVIYGRFLIRRSR